MKKIFFLLVAMMFGFALDSSATTYDHTLLTNGSKSVYFSAYKIAQDKYQFVIEANGTQLDNLGGSFCNRNGEGGYDMRRSLKVADDGSMIIVDVESTTAPTMYTPLYVMMPEEVMFQNIDLNEGMQFVDHAEVFLPGSEGEDEDPVKGNGAVWKITTSGADYTLTYSITWNTNRTLTFKIISLEGAISNYEGLSKQVSIDDRYYTFYGTSVTTTKKYNEGDMPAIFFYFSFTGDSRRIDISYEVGASNVSADGSEDNGTAWDAKYKSDDCNLEYEITWNDDKTLTITILSLTGSIIQQEGFLRKVCIDNVYYDFEASQYVTTTATYNKGDSPYPFFFYFPYTGNAKRIEVMYTVGDTNNGSKTDGIYSAMSTNQQQSETCYNLQGQRISAPANGQIYIKNGKKIIK